MESEIASKKPKLDIADSSPNSDDTIINDEMIMNAIFNPHNPLLGNQIVAEEVQPEDVNYRPESDVSSTIRQLEVDAVKAAEAGDLLRSLEILNGVVNDEPNYASAYNNRAQVLRLQGDTRGAFADLDQAIHLSRGHGRAASQAYTQRGLLHRLDGDDEKAISDFKCAARLGNGFAKTQLCEMNPYAALCNQMLSDVFSKVMRGEGTI